MDENAVNFFKKQAKNLHGAASLGDGSATARLAKAFPDGNCSLMRAQHVVATEAGFTCWKQLVTASSIELQLAATMVRIPLLNDFGIGLFRPTPKAERRQNLGRDRGILRQSLPAVEKTIEWLRQNVGAIKTINQKHTSYGLKHVAEPYIGYVTNGVFIAAAIIAGYAYQLVPDSPNVLFGMSNRSIRALCESSP